MKQEQKQKMSKNKLLSTKEFGKRNKVAFIFTPKNQFCRERSFLLQPPVQRKRSFGLPIQPRVLNPRVGRHKLQPVLQRAANSPQATAKSRRQNVLRTRLG